MNILYLDYVIPNKGVNLYLKKLNDNVTEFSNTDHLIKLWLKILIAFQFVKLVFPRKAKRGRYPPL